MTNWEDSQGVARIIIWQDLSTIYTLAVAAMCVDLSKAFNRLDHNKVITVLYDMGAPICALRLLYSYLENRRMQLHMSGLVSSVYELWGGGPQGGLLTVLLFNVNSNWLTDICQPSITNKYRFLMQPSLSTSSISAPR